MELRQLRYFLAVAEDLHFSRAAKRLGVAQPALSQQVRNLERELDAELLTRTTRAVDLTDAGRVLAAEARAVLEQADRVATAAHAPTGSAAGKLRLATASALLPTLAPRLLRRYRRRAPLVEIELSERSTAEQIEALRCGRLDAGIVHAPLSADDIASQALALEPLVAAIPADHALAGLDEVPLEALADAPFVWFPRIRAPALYDDLATHCRRRGFTPRVVREVDSASAMLALVGAGLGVSLVPAPMSAFAFGHVAFKPLVEPVPTTVVLLVWPRGRRTAAVNVLLETAQELYAGRPDAVS